MRRSRVLNLVVATVATVALSASIGAALLRSRGGSGEHKPHSHGESAPASPSSNHKSHSH